MIFFIFFSNFECVSWELDADKFGGLYYTNHISHHDDENMESEAFAIHEVFQVIKKLFSFKIKIFGNRKDIKNWILCHKRIFFQNKKERFCSSLFQKKSTEQTKRAFFVKFMTLHEKNFFFHFHWLWLEMSVNSAVLKSGSLFQSQFNYGSMNLILRKRYKKHQHGLVFSLIFLQSEFCENVIINTKEFCNCVFFFSSTFKIF